MNKQTSETTLNHTDMDLIIALRMLHNVKRDAIATDNSSLLATVEIAIEATREVEKVAKS